MSIKEIQQYISDLCEESIKDNPAITKDYKKMLTQQIMFISKSIEPYKDLEEELGIDLVTYFKIKNKLLKSYGDFEIFHNKYGYVHCSSILYKGVWCYRRTKFGTFTQEILYFKDYGKTWALTKEEVEK